MLNKDKTCYVEVCEFPVESKGLCIGHRSRVRKFNRGEKKGQLDLVTPIKEQVARYLDGDECVVPNCSKAPYSLWMCRNHYATHISYDVNLPGYFDLFEAGCVVCGSVERLCLDHDHNYEGTGDHAGRHVCDDCFRGILCGGCNKALGFVYDNPDTLMKLSYYLASKKRVVRETEAQGEGRRVE